MAIVSPKFILELFRMFIALMAQNPVGTIARTFQQGTKDLRTFNLGADARGIQCWRANCVQPCEALSKRRVPANQLRPRVRGAHADVAYRVIQNKHASETSHEVSSDCVDRSIVDM